MFKKTARFILIFQVSYLHATSLAFCQRHREKNVSWTWQEKFPQLSSTINNLDELSFLKEIIPNTLKLLADRDPTFEGSEWKDKLVAYSQANIEFLSLSVTNTGALQSLSSLVPEDPRYPSLIHVDLWNNNVLFNDQGEVYWYRIKGRH